MLVDRVWTGARLATLDPGRSGLGVVDNGAIASSNGRIVWVGPASEMPAFDSRERIDLDGRWVTPGLIDCHTHLVYGGNRAHEFELRLAGATYEEIARAGGGILSTVKATRAASEHELVAPSPTSAGCAYCRGRHHHRDQVRLWPGCRNGNPAAARRPRARSPAPDFDYYDLPRCACAAARSRRRQGCLHRPPLRPDAASHRRRGPGRRGRCLHGGHRLQRRADGARVRGGQAPGPAGQAARRPALQSRRRQAGRALWRAVRRPPGVHRRGGRSRHGQGRHRRGAAARRLLLSSARRRSRRWTCSASTA